MRRLADAREHLDGTLADRGVLEGNLRDMGRVNRRFGGTALSLAALRRLVATATPGSLTSEPLRVLDVGTGGGDIPLALIDADGPWTALEVTAVDSRPEVVDVATALTAGLGSHRRVTIGVADGRELPYPNAAFHVAHASLVLHHLSPADAAAFVRELARVASLGVIVNDLARGWRFWLGAWLVLHAMSRNRFTLHDGPLSVRRAYTRREARRIVADAGLREVALLDAPFGHRWAIAAARR